VANVFKAPKPITAGNIRSLCERILGVFHQDGELDTDLAGLAEVERSFIQLVLFPRAHLERKGSRLGMVEPASVLPGLLDRARLGRRSQARQSRFLLSRRAQ